MRRGQTSLRMGRSIRHRPPEADWAFRQNQLRRIQRGRSSPSYSWIRRKDHAMGHAVSRLDISLEYKVYLSTDQFP